MLSYVRTPSGATCKGVLQLEVTFIDVKNMCPHQEYRFNALTTKLMKKHAFHIKVQGDTYVPYTPLPWCSLILNLMSAAN